VTESGGAGEAIRLRALTAAREDRAAVAELDLNPIKVLPRGRGCVVVDALIVPRRAEEPP